MASLKRATSRQYPKHKSQNMSRLKQIEEIMAQFRIPAQPSHSKKKSNPYRNLKDYTDVALQDHREKQIKPAKVNISKKGIEEGLSLPAIHRRAVSQLRQIDSEGGSYELYPEV